MKFFLALKFLLNMNLRNNSISANIANIAFIRNFLNVFISRN